MHLIYKMHYYILSFIVISIIDLLVYQRSSRWYLTHFLINLVNTILTWSSVISLIQNPIYYNENYSSILLPNSLTISLQVYHILVYKNISLIDWIHHVVMTITLLITYIFPIPALSNYAIFFICGFPGCIDYMLLALVKERYIDIITEKKMNSYLNIWIRSPGIIIGICILYLKWLYLTELIPVSTLLGVSIVMFWNAQYFCYRVVRNYGAKSVRY